MITVKIAKLGAPVVEVALENGSNVGAALRAANVSSEGFQVRVNGCSATSSTTLSNGNLITLIPAIKGGSGCVMVKVAKLGSPVVEVCLSEGARAADALQSAGVSADGFQIRVNGSTDDRMLRSGDLITLIPAIKGGLQ